MRPAFLTLDEVVEIHHDLIARYGGEPGIRDAGLLESAVNMPRMGTQNGYVHADIAEMAAAYLFHIVRNHPFVDGNKRTGLAAAYVFLRLNGLELHAPEVQFEQVVRDTAEGKLDKGQVSDFLRRHIDG